MTKNFGQSGIGSSVQYGKSGPLLKSISGSFEIKDSADSALVNLSVALPTLDDHAATKHYVDSFVQGLDIKQSVRLATTEALPASTYNNGVSGVGATLTATANGALEIDGEEVLANWRILVKDQSSGIQNGIYVVSNPGSAGQQFVLTRAQDADQTQEVTAGMFTFIETGATLSSTGWVLTTGIDGIVFGTDPLVFAQFSSAGIIAVGAGSALDKIGNDLSVRVDGTSIGIDTTGNGRLIVRSTNNAGAVLLSSGTAGSAATWAYLQNLRGSSTGRNIVEGIDAGGANTNWLGVTSSDGTVATVSLAPTNANGTGDVDHVSLLLGGLGDGQVRLTTELNTSGSNTNLVIDANGTGSLVINRTITTESNANLVLSPNGTGNIAVTRFLTTLSNQDLVFEPDGTGDVIILSDINVSNNTIYSDIPGQDIHFLPNGTGVLSVSGTTDYEQNITSDDDIPNKAYVDIAIAANAPILARRQVIVADGTNSSFNIGTILPTFTGHNVFVTRVMLDVTTIFSGDDVAVANVVAGHTVMQPSENDILEVDTYIADIATSQNSTNQQAIINFFKADGSTPAIPTNGTAIATVFFSAI